MIKSNLKKYWLLFIFLVIILGLITFFDKGLSIGLLLALLLSGITFFVLSKIGVKSKRLYLLFLITFLVHLAATLFIYYAYFQPFGGGGGDYQNYHRTAVEIAQRFRQGNFSLKGISFAYPELYVPHYYPLIIGIIYTITIPEMIVGLMFGVWLAALSTLLTYLIVIEIGGTERGAFWTGLVVGIYPSYLFYGSLLLKDTLVVPLVLFGILLCLKLIKNFSWKNFLFFYIILTGLTHFRFYIGYALLFTFIFCWLIWGKITPPPLLKQKWWWIKKKNIYAIIIILLLGFLPEISANQGFYGIDSFRASQNPEFLANYQQTLYNPKTQAPSLVTQFLHRLGIVQVPLEAPVPPSGFGSSWTREKIPFWENPFKFLADNLKSFIYVLLGPFLWQLRYPRQLLALFETIPWYFLLFFVGKGILRSFKSGNKLILPLVLFSLMVLVTMAIFFNNYGIVTRIRIPAFITLLCFLPLGLPRIFQR